MSPLIYRSRHRLSQVLQDVPVGTDPALFAVPRMLLSGGFLQSRGAVLPGLPDLGLHAWAMGPGTVGGAPEPESPPTTFGDRPAESRVAG